MTVKQAFNTVRYGFTHLVTRRPALALALAAALVLTLWWGTGAIRAYRLASRTAARDAAENAADAQHEQKVGEQLRDADAHEGAANEAAVERRVAEANANNAQVRRAEAGANTRRTDARDRASKESYRKALNGNAALLPDVSDAGLCAELKRRGRPCPK